MLIEEFENIYDDEKEIEFPDFEEIYDIWTEELDLIMSMIQDYIEQETDKETKLNNMKYFNKLESDYESFFLSFRYMLNLLKVENDGDNE